MQAPPRRAIQLADLFAQWRASQPVPSPDGKIVVFVGKRPDPAANRDESHLFAIPAEGGEPRRLTQSGPSNTDPAWSPDGRSIAFTSSRSGTPQIWILPVDGGEARKLTDLRLGARRPVWFPDGKRLLAISTVYKESSDQAEIGRREDERKKTGPTGRVFDELMFRHWDTWSDGKLDHLFVIDAADGSASDLTPGPYPVPPLALTGAPDYAVAPDGSEVCFVSLRDDAQATSTNANLWTVAAAGGEPHRISTWEGCNAYPAYSPDGSRIAYCGMRRPGFESDKTELLVYDRASGKIVELAPGFDRSVGAPTWAPDGQSVFFSAQDRGRTRLWRVAATGGRPEPLTDGASDRAPMPIAGSEWLAFVRETATAPPEIWRVPALGGAAEPLTALNADNLAQIQINPPEEFWYEGAAGARCHGFLVRPPDFDPAKSYPVVFLIHGGPQGMFGLDFHERWNNHMMAAPGYVAVSFNPRGSTGYGQAFTDAINGEWGGACYEDLIRGFDHVLDNYPFCDRSRTAAAGASFGGYMINWIAGHTDRFKCLVSHDGIFNTEMMQWATDELWFTEWEFGGLPWEKPDEYRKWSPHLHVQNIKTPMLIVQGEQDFRCPVSESLTLFTALRRIGVPARLLYLPDEGHWVLKPNNRKLWWETVHGWLARYLGA